jgi:RNA-binding protein YlmH
MVRIRLTRKLAGRLNGIDVSNQQVGDIIELPDKAAAILIAEGWAEAVAEPPAAPHTP